MSAKTAFDLMKVSIYVSGNVDNHKNGGYSALMQSSSDGFVLRKTLGGYGKDTTVTRMTLKAVLTSLRELKKKSIVLIYTNSAQVSSGLNKNIYNWRDSAWTTQKGTLLEHADLWEQIYSELEAKTISHKVLLQKLDIPDDLVSATAKEALRITDTTSRYAMVKEREVYEVDKKGGVVRV